MYGPRPEPGGWGSWKISKDGVWKISSWRKKKEMGTGEIWEKYALKHGQTVAVKVWVLTVQSQGLVSTGEGEKTQWIWQKERGEVGRGTERPSNWKHHDREDQRSFTVALDVSLETRGTEYDSSSRHKNICLKSQRERNEERRLESWRERRREQTERETKEEWMSGLHRFILPDTELMALYHYDPPFSWFLALDLIFLMCIIWDINKTCQPRNKQKHTRTQELQTT